VIFVTVGTQAPFDRLVTAVDRWAVSHPDTYVIAQVGESRARFPRLDVRPWLSRREYEDAVRRADLVVSHAGIGTLLTARRLGRPLLIMPRAVRFGEHRDDHQIETARRLEALDLAPIVWFEEELGQRIDAMLREDRGAAAVASTRAALVNAVRRSVMDALGRPARG
jgi:UDP-N-acetylglucosamine transferase subunit ALG13